MKSSWLHRYAVLVAGCTLILILTGATVTSTEGLPTVNAPSAQAPIWIETCHRLLGELLPLLVAPIVWLAFRKDERRGLSLLAGTALIVCVGEAFLGNQAMGYQATMAPPVIGILHALLAQLLFTATVAITLLTSSPSGVAPDTAAEPSASVPRSLALIILGLVLLQVVLGDAYRHRAMGVILHILNAMVVTLVIFVAGILVTRKPATSETLRRAGVALMVITGIQVMLGFAVFILLLMFPKNNLSLVVTSVAHVAIGALTLAAGVIFAIQIRRDARVAPVFEGGAEVPFK